jgi:hypothetical protein
MAFNFDTLTYIILEQYAVPFAPFRGANFIFQHDNTRLRSVRIVPEYLDEVDIAPMQWPARRTGVQFLAIR